MKTVATAVVAGALVVATGCGREADEPSSTAEAFYAAVAQRDGVLACALLTTPTAQELEKDEGAPCPVAVLRVALEGARAASSEVYLTSATVRLGGGDTVFLDETPGGWRVSAAGCSPEPGEEAPYDCDVDS